MEIALNSLSDFRYLGRSARDVLCYASPGNRRFGRVAIWVEDSGEGGKSIHSE